MPTPHARIVPTRACCDRLLTGRPRLASYETGSCRTRLRLRSYVGRGPVSLRVGLGGRRGARTAGVPGRPPGPGVRGVRRGRGRAAAACRHTAHGGAPGRQPARAAPARRWPSPTRTPPGTGCAARTRTTATRQQLAVRFARGAWHQYGSLGRARPSPGSVLALPHAPGAADPGPAAVRGGRRGADGGAARDSPRNGYGRSAPARWRRCCTRRADRPRRWRRWRPS